MDGMNIKIGATVYTVSVCKLEAVWGQVRYDESAIRIADNLDPQSARSTLFHELIHATLTELGEDKDERHVTALANALLATLLNNPALLDLIRQ